MNYFFKSQPLAGLVLIMILVGCREISTIDRPYQRVIINNFSAPLRTLLPARNGNPNSLTVRVSGTISRPVMLAVDQLGSGQQRDQIRRDTLVAGTYTNKSFSGDFYSREAVELLVTGALGATGSLTIDWYAQ